jgi:diadenosine tetraphosphate (Ap4A) HIT family hydrolase
MDATKYPRKPFDEQRYVERCQNGPCFICEILAGNPAYGHHLVYEDETAVAFLNKYPSLVGYTLVAPRRHLEQVTGDFCLSEYLAFQQVLYRVAEAVWLETAAERVYLLSLGSQQGNRHVHWHVAPLPAGVPYEAQQLEALRIDDGYLDIPEAEMADLAARIGRRLAPA